MAKSRRLWRVMALLAFASCGREKPSTLESVRIVTRPILTSGPIYIADEEGYFKDEGIDLIFAEAPARTVQALPLLERERLDVLVATVGAGLFAAAKTGAQLRIVADRGHISTSGCEFNAIVGRADIFKTDSPTATELRGRKLSINAAITAEFVVDKFLAARGLTEDNLEIVGLSESLEPQAMRSKNIDLAHASEPFLTQLKDDKQRVVGRGSEYAPGAHFGVLIYGPTLTVKNRALGERFMAAYIRGIRQYAQGTTPRNVEILSKRMKFEPALLRKACFASIHLDGKLNSAWLNEFQQWAVTRRYLDAVVPIGDIVDSTFTMNASQRLNTARH